MEILLFGATGKTGKQILAQALEAGHRVTAFVRSPEKLEELRTACIFIQGDALDEVAVEQAIQAANFDAIIVAIGGDSLKHTGVRANSTANIVAALQEHCPEARLWVVSSAGTGKSIKQIGFLSKFFVRTVIAGPIKDHEVQEQTVRDSPLQYTIVRPVGLTEEAATGGAYVAQEQGKLPQSRIPRADVADFVVKNLLNPAYARKAVALSAS